MKSTVQTSLYRNIRKGYTVFSMVKFRQRQLAVFYRVHTGPLKEGEHKDCKSGKPRLIISLWHAPLNPCRMFLTACPCDYHRAAEW